MILPDGVQLVWISHDEPWSPGDHLSFEEEQRAQAYHFPKDAHRFRLVRSRLRRELASRLSLRSHEIEFQYNEHGKPSIEGPSFSISHSATWSVIAIGGCRPIGIDLEKIEHSKATFEMARHICTDYEFEAWQGVSAPKNIEAFFQIWTCKEAYLKALGVGLQIEPQQVETHFPDLRLAATLGQPSLPIAQLESPQAGFALALSSAELG